MDISGSKSILLQAGPTARAMALMEVLIATAIMTAAILGFLLIIREARSDLAGARANAQATAAAIEILRGARTTWAEGPYSGEQRGLSWRLSCALAPEALSPRIVVVSCLVAVAQTGREPITLRSSWLVPRESIVRAP